MFVNSFKFAHRNGEFISVAFIMNLDCKECSMQTALDCSQYHPGSLNELLYER